MKQLFPRRSGPSTDLKTQARAAAHRLLDDAQDGDTDKWDRVDWALRVTGDLPEDPGQRHFVTEVLVCMP